MVNLNQDDIDELIYNYYNELIKFSDVYGIEKINNLFKHPVLFSSHFRYIWDNVDYNIFNIADKLADNIPSLKFMKNNLTNNFDENVSNDVTWRDFTSIYSIFIYSAIHELNRDLSYNEKVNILHNILPLKLSLSQDLMSAINLPDLNKTFFKNINKIKWDKEALELSKILEKYWSAVSLKYGISETVSLEFKLCSSYLACCYAVNNNHSNVLKKDIVDAWLVTFDIILTDRTEIILNTEINQLESNLFKNKKVFKYTRKKGLSKPLAIFLSILFYLGILFIVMFLFGIIVHPTHKRHFYFYGGAISTIATGFYTLLRRNY